MCLAESSLCYDELLNFPDSLLRCLRISEEAMLKLEPVHYWKTKWISHLRIYIRP